MIIKSKFSLQAYFDQKFLIFVANFSPITKAIEEQKSRKLKPTDLIL